MAPSLGVIGVSRSPARRRRSATVSAAAQLDVIAEAVTLPLILGGAPAGLQDAALLAPRRVRICLQGHQPFMAAVNAVYETLKAIRAGIKPSALTGVAPVGLMKQVTRDADYARWTMEFLGG